MRLALATSSSKLVARAYDARLCIQQLVCLQASMPGPAEAGLQHEALRAASTAAGSTQAGSWDAVDASAEQLCRQQPCADSSAPVELRASSTAAGSTQPGSWDAIEASAEPPCRQQANTDSLEPGQPCVPDQPAQGDWDAVQQQSAVAEPQCMPAQTVDPPQQQGSWDTLAEPLPLRVTEQLGSSCISEATGPPEPSAAGQQDAGDLSAAAPDLDAADSAQQDSSSSTELVQPSATDQQVPGDWDAVTVEPDMRGLVWQNAAAAAQATVSMDRTEAWLDVDQAARSAAATEDSGGSPAGCLDACIQTGRHPPAESSLPARGISAAAWRQGSAGRSAVPSVQSIPEQVCLCLSQAAFVHMHAAVAPGHKVAAEPSALD